MNKNLNVGITFDTKENYNIEANDWKHSDFSTLADITYVKEIMQSMGFNASLIGNFKNLNKMFMSNELVKYDIIFNTVEGLSSRNREGLIPSFLELNGIPFTGSDAYCTNLALNKAHTSILAQYLDIKVPQFYLINKESDFQEALKTVKGPWILKPNYEGSSSGVNIAYNENDMLEAALRLLQEYNQPILCQEYIDGKEIVVSQMLDFENTQIIGAAEVVRKDGQPIGIYDSKDKFTDTCQKIRVNLPEQILNTMYNASIKLHKFLGCYDYSRTDFRVDKNNNIYFLEITPLPSIGPGSGFVKCCEFGTMEFDEVLFRIILNAYYRYKEKQNVYQKRHYYYK